MSMRGDGHRELLGRVTPITTPPPPQVRKYLAEYLPLPSEGQSSDEEGGAKGALQAIPWAELGLALVINKMFGPLQILLTLSITPRLAPILLSWGPTKTMVSGITTIISYFKWKQA
eukprot:TRINITY_DN15080_c0_g1_i2.p1 TRINITY_DN15080_c0_g1~~TRINITY_DN15080_c0_g1_i2.p1  ORF type:complete len:116 (+),score=26.28 TRINITY_DN15080_c0_g1_i2:3-350(+)